MSSIYHVRRRLCNFAGLLGLKLNGEEKMPREMVSYLWVYKYHH